MTPEAMRRLADLEIEKQFGIHAGDGKGRQMPAPQSAQTPASTLAHSPNPAAAVAGASRGESDQEFERRTTAEGRILASSDTGAPPVEAGGPDTVPKGPIEAIALYNRLLTQYPNYKNNDQVLYQMARAYDELGRTDEAMETMERVIRANPNSEHYDEVQFRRGEYFFTRRKFRDARVPIQRSPAWALAPRTMSSLSTSSGGRSTSRTSTRMPCARTSRCSITRCRPATISIRSTSGRTNAASPILFER